MKQRSIKTNTMNLNNASDRVCIKYIVCFKNGKQSFSKYMRISVWKLTVTDTINTE